MGVALNAQMQLVNPSLTFRLHNQFKSGQIEADQNPMTKFLLPFSVLMMISASTLSHAAELSPWLGSDGQAPFQLDPNTMVAVTFAADPLQTGSTSKRNCNLETCTLPPLTAKTAPTNP
jgi:hypothetical protein